MPEVLALDCVVIGGGVIGLAIARELAMAGREVFVLEAEGTVGSVTSSRNSEVIHAGLYYPAGSLKAQLCVSGKRKLYSYCRERQIPHRQCGKLVVASSLAEVDYLENLLKQAHANGVEDCRLIEAEELARLEPRIKGYAALLSPSTGIIDSHRLMEAFVTDIEAFGGTIVLSSPVLHGELLDRGVRLFVGGRDPAVVETQLVVNAAGLAAWEVSLALQGLDAATFYAAVRTYWPDLADAALQPAYAGIRPKVVGPQQGGGGDFIIQGPAQTGHPAYVALYGMESPGLTASMAVAERVHALAQQESGSAS